MDYQIELNIYFFCFSVLLLNIISIVFICNILKHLSNIFLEFSLINK